MLWFNEYKRNWRLFFLVMLIVAMIGPWFYDRSGVPLPYRCSFPNIRLDDDFCGVPIAITWLLREIPSQLSYLINGLISGDLRSYVTRDRLVVLFSIFLVIPFLGTPIVIIWEKQQYWSVFHRVALGFAAGTGLLIGRLALRFSIASWMLWGVWLYILLTAGLLIVEVLAASKNSN